MNKNDFKFSPLNEDETRNEVKPSKENKVELTDELLDRAINALDEEKLDDDSVKKVISAIFGDSAIYPNSNPDQVNDKADNFVKIAEENGVVPQDDTDNQHTQKQNDSFEYFSPWPLVNEAKDSIKSKIKNFIEKWLDKLIGANKNVQENKTLKQFHTKINKAKAIKASQDKTNKQNADIKSKAPKNLNELKQIYIGAGKSFVAHTCTMTYKMLKTAAEKQKDLSLLAKELIKTDTEGTNNYLKDIKDINERKIIDAASFAIGLAKKKKEANNDKKLPQEARNTKEALQLAARYKKAFPKYYQSAMNIINDSYTEGINEAQRDLREGKTLRDPITGEEVSSEIISPLWKVGSKVNDFFSKEPLNVATIGPKIIFGVFNALTSKTAKNIYKGLFKFGRAIYQNVTAKEQQAENENNTELFKCDLDTLTKEFDELVKQHSNDEDEVDKSNNGKKEEKPVENKEQQNDSNKNQEGGNK